MGIKLATILEKSVELEMILDLPYYDDAFAALVSERNVDKDEKALNKKSPFHADDLKCVNFKASYGLLADANKSPLLDRFGILVDNLQTLQLLLQ